MIHLRALLHITPFVILVGIYYELLVFWQMFLEAFPPIRIALLVIIIAFFLYKLLALAVAFWLNGRKY